MESCCSKLSDDLHRAIKCYGSGVAVPALVMGAPAALLPFPIFWAVGAIFGLPVLVLILVLIALFRRNIHRHLGLWCFSMPFLTVFIVGAVFATLAYVTDISRSAMELIWVPNPFTIGLSIGIFVAAMASAAEFYRETRKLSFQTTDGCPLSRSNRLEVTP